MARSQANIYLTIWNDPDFLLLSPDAKLLYFTLLTHPTLNYCGIVDWRETRLAKMLGNITPERLRMAAWELGQKRLIAVDPDTEEALVRSFVRHDGVLKSPNVTKGMVREYGAITSLKLRELVTLEVRRALHDDPDLKGVKEAVPVTKQFPNSSGNPSDLVPEWFQFGSQNPGDKPVEKTGNPSDLVPLPLTSTSTSTYVERGAASDEAATRPKRGSRISTDWMPPPDVIDTIRSEHPGLDLKSEHQDFIDYWLAAPGQKGVKSDWVATWRRWMRKNGKEQAEKQNSRYRNTADRQAAIMQTAKAADQYAELRAVQAQRELEANK